MKFLTPFDFLDMFDVVCDFAADMMHMVNAFFDHMVPLLKGERPLTEPVMMALDRAANGDGPRVPFEAEEIARRKARNKEKMADHAEATLVHSHHTTYTILLRYYCDIIVILLCQSTILLRYYCNIIVILLP